MICLTLIRHGATAGNERHAYIGTTDEPLTPEGVRNVLTLPKQEWELVFSSPLLRCRQTASLLCPDKEPFIIPSLRECDFGRFENKNYQDLTGDAEYQRWIDSQGTLPFPGGESRESFRFRCLQGFAEVLERCRQKKAGHVLVVTHGGVIMNLLEAWAEEKKPFYDWMVKNAEGYSLLAAKEQETESWKVKVLNRIP